jgi:hypothetical protein
MDGWTKLHERAAESVSLSELLDEEPEAFALFMLMLAKAGVWGRFPGHPKLLKARVAPMSERLTAKRIAELVPLLEKHEVVTGYTVDGVALLYNTNHFTYNGKQAWHRVGKPEFPPPPGFCVPTGLAAYLTDVHAGKYKNKTVAGECEKMRLVYDHSTGVVHGSSLGLVAVEAALQTLDVRRETSDVRRETSDVRNDEKTEEKKSTGAPAGWQLPADFHAITSNYPEIDNALRAHFGTWTQAYRERWWYQAACSLDSDAASRIGFGVDDLLRCIADDPPTNSSRGDWYTDEQIKRLRRERDAAKPRPGPQRLGNAPMTRAEAIAEAERLEAARNG